ncbi:MAG: TusE/DsrC/DsvC family sulfur relay protein [Buchnera aphidicola (Chaetogeoica yunlongensis)]
MNFINNWNKKIAQDIAKKEFIKMTKNHWEIIYILRDFYLKFNLAPSMRILIKLLEKKQKFTKKYSSRYILKLFPNNSIKKANKIAGIPTSNNCI